MTEPEQHMTNEADNAPPVPESPVVKIFKMIGLGPKAPPAGKAPVQNNAPATKTTAAAPAAVKTASTPRGAATSQQAVRPVIQPPAGPLTTVVVRNEFYRDGFRNMIKIAILEAAIIVGLILTLIVYINNSKSEDRYFATTADGRIMQLVPLDKPNMSPASLMSWVAQATTEVMTFGYHDYQRRLQQSSRHFTKTGWESFTNALQKARIIDSVQAQRQVVTASPISAPILLNQGVINGKYRWIIELPLLVNYQGSVGAGGSRTDKLNVKLVVERVPSLENPQGVGIEQWIATTR